jgi:uncharacterized protein YqeY
MALMDALQSQLMAAMKAGESLRVETIRMLLSSLKNATIDAPNHLLSNVDEIAILSREAKKRNESIDMFTKGGRQDLVEHEKKQLEIIKTYLPTQADDVEIEKVIKDTAKELGAGANFGNVMKIVMSKLAGRADGNKVSAIVKQTLT